MSALKFGIIGTNFISEMFAEAALSTDGVEIGAVYSRTLEKGSKFAEKFNIEKAYTDYAKMLSSDIDAVYVASPNSLHAEYSIQAMKRGKHVLCEKPIASNSKEFDAMTSCAIENKRVLLEAMRPEFDPMYDAVRGSLDKIGKIRSASFEFCQYSSRYDAFKDGNILRAFDPEYSNAAVMDIGVYPIRMIVSLFGKPHGKILSKSVILKNGMEGAGEVILPYNSTIARVSYSKICDSVNPSVITGEDGSIIIDKISAPKEIKIIMRNGEEKTVSKSDVSNNMIYEIAEFARLVKEENMGEEYGDRTKYTMEILDEIRRQNGIIFLCE